jgi:RNA polymerase primary sigma factor
MALTFAEKAPEFGHPSKDDLRARALRDFVSAVVLGAMRPLSRREVLRQVDLHLQGAWTDVTRLEVETALDGLDDERIEIDLNGRFHAVEMSSGIDESLPHWVAATRAVEVLEETEGSDSETLRNRQFGEIFKMPLLESHAEKVVGTRASHDRAARNELVERNLRLARAMAGRWERSTTPALDGDDLFQEACLGLIRAAQKFDPRRGFKFSTYATWWLRQALARAVDAHSRTIRVPVHICERVRFVSAARRKLLEVLPEREPTQREVCQEAGISLSQLEEVQRVQAMECVPVDEMTSDQELRVVLMEVDSLEGEVFAQMSRFTVDRALSLLSPREAEILRRRLGLDGHPPWTLDAIGRELDLTRERIRQIEQSALETLAERSDLVPAPGSSA